MVAHGVLRLVLSLYSDSGPRELSFQNVPSGKPILGGADASTNNIRFNLSHSLGLALIAVSKDREVGVDLEKIRTDRDVTALAARFFGSSRASSDHERKAKHWAFSRIWVAKEAVLKAGGSVLTFPLGHYYIELS